MTQDFFAGVNPEDAFLDSSNLPGFNKDATEGKIIRSLSLSEIYAVGIIFLIISGVFIYKLFTLQVLQGAAYAQLSEENRLTKTILFAGRGIITDRLGRKLAWNTPKQDVDDALPSIVLDAPLSNDYALRTYTPRQGLSHILGFVSYPEHDAKGNWWRTDFVANGGVESTFNAVLSGTHGSNLIEINAVGKVISKGSVVPPVPGQELKLSLDAELTEQLHKAIKAGSDTAGFKGGAGVIIDVHTGEVVAMTSYPEFDLNIMTDASDRASIAKYNRSAGKPFLNRAVQGSYTPGSIIKPYMGAVALEEGIITEYTKILSTGVLKVPNPYHPGKFSKFRDWRKGFGLLDVRRAIKMSSSIFFYVVGGGFEGQRGLGIAKISHWAGVFGFGSKTGIELPGERLGLVPTPKWKKETFGDDKEWNLGNTYHSSIGQYGWLVTPLQAARYIASIGNGGNLYKPTLIKQLTHKEPIRIIPIKEKNFEIIREGMRQGAQSGTAQALNVSGISIAAKTGTAQLGRHNEFMNSWVVGYWPFDYNTKTGKPTKEPQFAFAVVLEKAPAETLRGAAPAMNPFFTWLVKEHGEDYAVGEYPTKIKETAIITATTTLPQ